MRIKKIFSRIFYFILLTKFNEMKLVKIRYCNFTFSENFCKRSSFILSMTFLISFFFFTCNKGNNASTTESRPSCVNGEGDLDACTSCNVGYSLVGPRCVSDIVISFDLNQGTGVAPEDRIIQAGDTVTVPGAEGASRPDHVFLGWSTSREATGTDWLVAGRNYTLDYVDTPISRINFYAVWGSAYGVRYNLNGGSGTIIDATSYLAGTTVILASVTSANRPSLALSFPNDGFWAWGLNPEGTVGVGRSWYTAGETVGFASNTTLYALWYYPITYNCDGGTFSGELPTISEAVVGQNLSLPNTGCAKLQHGQIGWSTSGALPSIATMPNYPLVLRPIFSRNVDIDANGLIEISTPEQLNAIRYNLEGTSWKTNASDTGLSIGCPNHVCRGYELNSNIDFLNTKWGTATIGIEGGHVIEGWEPIGNCGVDNICNYATDEPFVATFEGNGFVIRNLYINHISRRGVGLFAMISTSASLNQVALDRVLTKGNGFIGGIVGYQKAGVITNSYVTMGFLGSPHNENIGGLVGVQQGGVISNSYTSGSISGSASIGGLVGNQLNAQILNSYSNSSIRGNTFIGGLVGVYGNSIIRNSYATGSIVGSSYVGGIIGWNAVSGSVSNTYWDKQTTGQSSSVGGGGSFGSGATDGLTTMQMQGTSGDYPSGLGSCFRFSGANRYPQVFTIVNGTCSTTLLHGTNSFL